MSANDDTCHASFLCNVYGCIRERGPVLSMLAMTCALVLALADYRAGEGTLSAELLPAEPATPAWNDAPPRTTAPTTRRQRRRKPSVGNAAGSTELRTLLRGALRPRAGDAQRSVVRAYRSWVLRNVAFDSLHTVSDIRRAVHRIRNGEALSAVLLRGGVSVGDIHRWIDHVDRIHDVDHVRPGQAVSIELDLRSGRLRGFFLQLDDDRMLVARNSGGVIDVQIEPIPYDKMLRVASGRVYSSFAAAAHDVGVPERIVSQVADVLGWELDLLREVKDGAMFRVAYEELVARPFAAAEPGRLIAVQLDNHVRPHEAYYFPGTAGVEPGYYDRSGRGLGGRFLRYPVAYTRIASRFAERRFHPVLRVRRPHYGVDFAAPVGTPVRAIADGTVAKAGWYGGNGRLVRLRHDGGFESGYAHLSRIAARIRKGTQVRKGQTIGYVGSSGLATGPHLHFAMYRHGRYIDPLKLAPAPVESLRGRQRTAFLAIVAMLEPLLAGGDVVPYDTAERLQTAALTN